MHNSGNKRLAVLIRNNGPCNCSALLRAVATSCGIDLIPWSPSCPESLAGVIEIFPCNSNEVAGISPTIPTFRFELAEPAECNSILRFSGRSIVPIPWRGRTLVANDVAPIVGSIPAGDVMAECNGRPVWSRSVIEGARHDVSIHAKPWIIEDMRLFEHLNGHHFMRLLPFIDWLRSLSDWSRWNKPGTRACFMFDDPNLHSCKYGYLCFSTLASFARRSQCHISFATIPLDQYYINANAAQIFRGNSRELSLLIHGNDHTYRELGRELKPSQSLAKIAKAVRRIKHFEKRSGICVSRVIAPPHGAFTFSMARCCAAQGIEAACVSWGSLWSSNPDENSTRLLGADAIAIIESLPIIPRFRLARESQNHILLAMYLEQPLVLAGHHWDVADGFSVLSELSEFMNGIGEIKWLDMSAIARSNLWWCHHEDVLYVRPFSRYFEVNIPEGTSLISIHAPWVDVSSKAKAVLSLSNGSVLDLVRIDNGSLLIAIPPGAVLPQKLRVQIQQLGANMPIGRNLFSPAALVRRIITESRDRIMPQARRIRRWSPKMIDPLM